MLNFSPKLRLTLATVNLFLATVLLAINTAKDALVGWGIFNWITAVMIFLMVKLIDKYNAQP